MRAALAGSNAACDTLCMPVILTIHDQPLPYESRLEERAPASIDLIVIHCTELPDMATAREFGERVRYASGTGNSGHYYVDVDGSIYRYIADTRIANHTVGYNSRSIGIELANVGRYPYWGDSRHQAFTVPYSGPQIESLLALLRKLRNDHAGIRYIAGHEDLDLRLEPAVDDAMILLPRRQDPGPLFPWPRVIADSPLERLHAPPIAATKP